MKRLAAAMALLVLLGALPAPAAAPAEITVSGNGTVTLPPDLATMDATVETNAESINDAISENNARYERVVAALGRAGIARTDVTLSNYNVNYNPKPKFVRPNDEQRYGYTVNRSFSVKVHRIAMAGQAIDACTSNGATAVNDVGFTIANPVPARDRAISLAVANAREVALKIAGAAGLRIAGIKSMDYGGGPIEPQTIVMARAMPAPAPTPPTELDQSNVSVTVNVNVVFLAVP
jgi:hypothetical protein